MAKEKKQKADRGPGIFSQFKESIQFLKAENPRAVPVAILIGVVAFILITVVGLLLSGGAILTIALWTVMAIITGYLTALLILSRSANSAVFKKFANEPGRVSLIVGTMTRRFYKGSNQPVAINPRTKDMIFRMVGPAGVILLGDGASTSTKAMLEDERRKTQRVASGVTVHTMLCSENGDGVPLRDMQKAIRKLKRTLNRAEINAVQNRLTAIDTRGGLPIPKGIDPMKIRASKRMR